MFNPVQLQNRTKPKNKKPSQTMKQHKESSRAEGWVIHETANVEDLHIRIYDIWWKDIKYSCKMMFLWTGQWNILLSEEIKF